MADGGPQIVDLRQSPTALRVQRGVMRLLRANYDFACLSEVPLANGRRADVLGIGPKGEIWIVEIKSSLIDFRVDAKWPDYKDFCDRFFFAVEPDFPRDILPVDCGLIVADAHGGEIVRPAPQGKLNGNRRRVLTLEIAISANRRLARVLDPDLTL